MRLGALRDTCMRRATLGFMFMRARWFVLGSAATLGATVFVVSRARTLPQPLPPRGGARAFAAPPAGAAGATGGPRRTAPKVGGAVVPDREPVAQAPES